MYKCFHKPIWNENILGPTNDYVVAVWNIGSMPYCEIIGKKTGVATGGWKYEAS